MNDVTHWVVPVDHPAFAGHFPGNPILPGVVLLDMAVYAITMAAGIRLEGCEISAIKFLSPVRPGEKLEIRQSRAAGSVIRFDITAGLRKIASGNIVLRSAA